MNLETIVENLLSGDNPPLQKAAEQELSRLLEQEYLPTVVGLSGIVRNGDSKQTIRQSAALAFKNAISSKDPTIRQMRQEIWMKIPPETRGSIKENILAGLRTDKAFLGRSVAQCVANVALCELVRGEWQDLIDRLENMISSPGAENVLKQSCLEAIGYICEEISMQAISNFSHKILNGIIIGLRKDEPSQEVRLAAATAFYNSIDFFKGNFENEEQRNIIMTVVCEATQDNDVQLKVAALQCLVRIVQFYYEFMEPYMRALLPISLQAMSSDVPEVVLQGIEFWSTVCEMEINLNFEEAEARDEGRVPEHRSFKFVSQLRQFIIQTLLPLMAKQPDVDEGDDWVPSKAASVCLMLIAQCVPTEILPHVIPFVAQNIGSPDWHYKDAACIAFGSVLEGPEPELLKGIVEGAYNVILAMMADENVSVRDSAAWVVQRMCQLLREAVLQPDRFRNTVVILRENLRGPPRVAANVCWALGSLAEASYEHNQTLQSGVPDTFAFSGMFREVIEELIKTAYRGDSSQNNLRTAAFAAAGEFLSHSPKDCYPVVWSCTVLIHGQLVTILQSEPQLSSAERNQRGDYCQHLLALLQTCIKRLHPEQLALAANDVVRVCEDVLRLHDLPGRSLQAEPEAFMCLHALLELLGESFFPYVEQLIPHIYQALISYTEHSLVNGALSLVGEMCRTFEVKLIGFVPEFLRRIVALISLINDPSGLVKPKAIQTLGDVAISLGPRYLEYAPGSLECLKNISTPQDHDVWLETLDAILDSCIGIINGLRGDGFIKETRDVIAQYQTFILSLIAFVANEVSVVPDSTISNSAAIIGEFCNLFGPEVLRHLDREDFYALLNKGRKSNKVKTKNFSTWALREIKKLKSHMGLPLNGHGRK